MICPNCSQDKHFFTQLTMGGPVSVCGECKAPVPRERSQTQAPDIKQPGADAPRAAIPAGTQDILALAKGRLEVIEIRLRELGALQAEAEMLRRMIYAAEPTTPVLLREAS